MRNYYMRIVVREYCGFDQAAPPVLAATSVRVRLGIFAVNEWRERAKIVIRKLGYEPNFSFGERLKSSEWDHLVFIYGTFDRGGKGRSGSQLWRIPAKRLDGQKAKTPWNELTRAQLAALTLEEGK